MNEHTRILKRCAMASASSGGSVHAHASAKKPWRFYYAMVFPYCGAVPRDKVRASCSVSK